MVDTVEMQNREKVHPGSCMGAVGLSWPGWQEEGLWLQMFPPTSLMVQFSTPAPQAITVEFSTQACCLLLTSFLRSIISLRVVGIWTLAVEVVVVFEGDGLKGSFELCLRYASLSMACVMVKVMNTCLVVWLRQLHVVYLGQTDDFEIVNLHAPVHTTLPISLQSSETEWGFTCGGVYVICIYSHARWELL